MDKQRKKVLIISHDKIGAKMAGPGIRYHYMAEFLSSSFDVTVGFFDRTYLPDASFKRSYKTKSINAYSFEEGFSGVDYVIALWLSESMLHYCNIHNIFVVFDLYAPVPVENLVKYIFSNKKISQDIDDEFSESIKSYRKFFENGDLFLTSNRRQLDYWVGYVFGAGLIRPSGYAKRPMYDRFMYAPMGIDSTDKIKKSDTAVMKGHLPGIKKSDKVMLWTGGVWDWFDAQNLIRAMVLLKETEPTLKLVFFGTQHPNPSIPEMDESLQARRLAKKLGVLDASVIFMNGWVDYSERLSYLAEADLAVYAHKPSIEAEFSHRTRVLDHILAELPTVATEGDYFADDVINGRLGATCEALNPQALSSAISNLLDKKRYEETKAAIRAEKQSYDWANTLLPLKEYLLSNPAKLQRATNQNVLNPDKKIIKLAKKYTPTPAKKVMKRTIRLIKK